MPCTDDTSPRCNVPLVRNGHNLRCPALVSALFLSRFLTPRSEGAWNSDTFVHLFEWSWEDVAKECEEWLGPKGFAAVLISPPNEHKYVSENPWRARYQPVSYKLVSRSGNQAQFESMIQRCKNAGVGIYADVVANHMAPLNGTGVAGTSFGHRSYAPVYDPSDFHHDSADSLHNCQVDNYQDAQAIQNCDLSGMPDLCTECEKVQKTVVEYITNMEKMEIAGFRVDAAKHMNSFNLGQILSQVNSSLYRFLDVIGVPGEAVQPADYTELGPVTEFAFMALLATKFHHQGQFDNDLQSLGAPHWGLLPSDKAVVFIDDHETQRNGALLTHKNEAVYRMINAFMLAWPYGYPKLMSSYNFTDKNAGAPSIPVHTSDMRCSKPWICEHRWPSIANMVAFRRAAGDQPVSDFVVDTEADGNTMAFCRGNAGCIAFNRNPSRSWHPELRVSMPAGEYCDIAQSDEHDCPTVRVSQEGFLQLVVSPMGIVALRAGAKPGKPAETFSAETSNRSIREWAVFLIGTLALFSMLCSVARFNKDQRTPEHAIMAERMDEEEREPLTGME